MVRWTRFKIAVLACNTVALAQSGGPYHIRRSTIDGGGGVATGGAYVLNGTMGQPDAEVISGGSFTLWGGFWMPAQADVTPEPPTALDAECFNGATPTATPCGTNADCPVGQACRLKNRFLSINPADTAAAATPSALQVTVISVPNAPAAVNGAPYNYPAMVGDMWWVGAATNRVNDQTPYITAPLECTGTPLIQDWNAVGDLHIYGDAIVPGATYEIRACAGVAGPCSVPLVLATALHGDTRDAYNLTNFADVSAMVGEFSTPNAPTSLLKAHAWIRPSNMTAAMGAPFGLDQVSAAVQAFQGQAPPAPTLGANQCP